MNSYHNSTNTTGEMLKAYESKAHTQDEMVLQFFKENNALGVTPERCLRHFQIREKLSSNRWSNTPVTSVRRSFSNLKNKGLICKSNVQVMGDYGREISVWKLVK